MIQSILFFALGFLCAGFIALMIAPAVWRRAVTMTRKRVEASVPLTLDEIQADKDRLRAEFAMSARRLEMSAKSLKEKAAAQTIDIGRGREEIKALGAELAQKNRSIEQLEAAGEALRAELRQRGDDVRQLAANLAEAEETIEQRALEVEKLGRMYDDASFSSSSRQIELVARESELEQLAGDLALLQGQAREAEKRSQEIESESRISRDALKAETKKLVGLEKKITGMLSALADRDERLERTARELEQLRESVMGNAAKEDDLQEQLTDARQDKARLEAELADLTAKFAAHSSNAGAEMPATSPSTANERLEGRLTALTRENRKLKAGLAELERSGPETGSGREDDVLRERIGSLAAQVVHLTSKLEGPGSPIARALSLPAANTGSGGDGGEKTASLADRVRALQKAASAG